MFLLSWIVLFMVGNVLEAQILNNNQIYNQQQQKFAQQPQQLVPTHEPRPTYGGAKEVALANTNAGYIASKFDIMQHPFILAQNILFGLAAAIGITRLGEYLVTPNYKKIGENLSHEEALTKTPLYKFGKALDDLLEKTPIPKIVEKAGELKDKTLKFLGKSDILSEMGSKIKEGTAVLWNMGRVYQDGKGNEALEEFVDFIEIARNKTQKINGEEVNKLYAEVIPNEAKRLRIDELMKQLKEERITKAQVTRTILKENLLEDVSIKNLKKHLNEGTLDKIFGTTPNLNASLAKSKFFNNATKGLKPISKTLNNLTLMIMEGVGGGVLGGKMAMMMSIVGLVSAFNACSKAGVAKREKEKLIREGNFNQEQIKEMKKGPWSGESISAFMEDFSGFTLGAYIMTFPLGVGLNKVLGLANLGRDNELANQAAEKMGIHGEKHLYQRSVMRYNEAVQNDKRMKEYIDILEGKRKHTWFNRFKKFFGFTNEQKIQESMIDKLKLHIAPKSSKAEIVAAIKELKGQRTSKWFSETREFLKKAGKSQLTWGSIFNENAYNKGGTMKRALRFAVQKPLEVAAKILSLGKFKLYKQNAGFTNFFRKFGGIGGGLGRIALVGFVLTVPFRNLFMKTSHKIFGKPSFSQYDEVKGVYDEDKIKKQEAESVPKQVAEAVPRPKIKLPQQDAGPVFQPQQVPTYQQQVTPSNPYENEIKPLENITPVEKKDMPEENSVRSLDNYSYIPKV